MLQSWTEAHPRRRTPNSIDDHSTSANTSSPVLTFASAIDASPVQQSRQITDFLRGPVGSLSLLWELDTTLSKPAATAATAGAPQL